LTAHVFFRNKKKETFCCDQQQQQHIQYAVKLHNSKLPVEGLLKFGEVVFAKFFIFIHLYFPGYLPGQELAPSSKLEGLPAGS
jgi:hypothetical protein